MVVSGYACIAKPLRGWERVCYKWVGLVVVERSQEVAGGSGTDVRAASERAAKHLLLWL